MANKEHLKILEQGVEVWNQWRTDNRSVEPDLSEASFFYKNFSNADFNFTDFSRANLSHAKFIGSIFYKAEMNGADLSWGDFSKTDFYQANLIRTKILNANLRQADFTRANLNNSDLSFTRLQKAVLSGANLNEANLMNAELLEVNFSDSNLHNADMTRAIIGRTIFDNNNLNSVRGLETIQHESSSIIGITTIYRSKGSIPEIFLRGAGISEEFITFMPSLAASVQPIQFYSCFISYSHEDQSFARRLHDALQGRGIRCWMDEHQLLPGQKISTEVDRGIRLWDKVLLCCSEDSLKSWWVENEIQIAFDKEQQLTKQRNGEEVLALIPLNLDGYLLSNEWKSGWRMAIRSRLAADFTGWATDNSKFEVQFKRLVKALRADAGGRESPPESRL